MCATELKIKAGDNGNALFLILIAVALFAALSYAITQSGRGGGNIDRETAMLHSGTVLQYPGMLRQAHTRMQLINGCGPEEISFHHDGWGHTQYQHSPPLPDKCNIYHPDGGGLSFQKTPSAGVNNGSDIMFTSDAITALVPSGRADANSNLSFMISHVPDEVCRAINRQLGFDEVLLDHNDYLDGGELLYSGDFIGGDGLLGPTNDCNNTPICEADMFCFTEMTGGQLNIFTYYMVRRSD